MQVLLLLTASDNPWRIRPQSGPEKQRQCFREGFGDEVCFGGLLVLTFVLKGESDALADLLALISELVHLGGLTEYERRAICHTLRLELLGFLRRINCGTFREEERVIRERKSHVWLPLFIPTAQACLDCPQVLALGLERPESVNVVLLLGDDQSLGGTAHGNIQLIDEVLERECLIFFKIRLG